MYVFLIVLIIIVCILLGLIVLVQNSKGGGLVSGMQGSNQYMGVRQTSDFLEKATWTLAAILLALSILSIFIIPKGVTETETSRLKKHIDEKGLESVPAQPAQDAVPLEQ